MNMEMTLKDGFQTNDDFGPARVIQIRVPSLGLIAATVIDNIACGSSIGGVRMAPDVSIEECFRLARAMTWKNAAAGLAHGGGKLDTMAPALGAHTDEVLTSLGYDESAIAALRAREVV